MNYDELFDLICEVYDLVSRPSNEELDCLLENLFTIYEKKGSVNNIDLLDVINYTFSNAETYVNFSIDMSISINIANQIIEKFKTQRSVLVTYNEMYELIKSKFPLSEKPTNEQLKKIANSLLEIAKNKKVDDCDLQKVLKETIDYQNPFSEEELDMTASINIAEQIIEKLRAGKTK